MATEQDTFHRILCVAAGYSTALIGLGWYLQSTLHSYGRNFNRAIRDGIKQQFVLLKVCSFIFIEVSQSDRFAILKLTRLSLQIVLFPAACGFAVHLATYPLFPNTTLQSRLELVHSYPITSFFLTWLTGTSFMFSFSSAIDALRSGVRPGLIWFVRDPSSNDFHPIKEILEKSSWSQAKKIGTSGLLYGGAIGLSLGVNVWGLRYGFGGQVLPLRWPSSRPFALPVDLLLYRFLIPFTITRLDPRTRLRQFFSVCSKRYAHELRISDFIFGERIESEQGTPIRQTWLPKLFFKKDNLETEDSTSSEISYRKDGGFARVPGIDTIKVVTGRKMFVRTDESGNPLDTRGKEIVEAQVKEMNEDRKKDRYRIVYIPPDFRKRVGLFVGLVWLTGSLGVSTLLALPCECSDSLLETSADLYRFCSNRWKTTDPFWIGC